MPTYDYVCSGCGHRFEEFQSMAAPLLRKCPKCKKAKLERLIGAGAGVIFKGSGFYQTDYKNNGGGKDGADKGGGDKGADQGTGDSAGKGNGSNGGCAPTCGTDAAPTGCKMPKKKSGD